jgi:hypothetical protein
VRQEPGAHAAASPASPDETEAPLGQSHAVGRDDVFEQLAMSARRESADSAAASTGAHAFTQLSCRGAGHALTQLTIAVQSALAAHACSALQQLRSSVVWHVDG